MNARQLIELRPAVAAENAYHRQPVQQSQRKHALSRLFSQASPFQVAAHVGSEIMRNRWRMLHGKTFASSTSRFHQLRLLEKEVDFRLCCEVENKMIFFLVCEGGKQIKNLYSAVKTTNALENKRGKRC